MKKLCTFLLMALLMVPVWAGADDYFIPEPGHFFGETMVKTSGRNYTMFFDEDPRDMFNAYVSLLQTDYEMKKLSITDTDHIFTYDGVPDSGVTISYISGKDGYRIEVSLHSLVSTGKREQYDPDWVAAEEPAEEKSTAKGQVAWDDGRMISDPGDFLGYEIDVIGTWDRTGSVLVEGAYVEYKYEEIAKDDILAYAKALHDSPYFEYNGKGIISHNYWLLYFDYTGANEALLKECKGYRTAKGYGNNRKSDLSIYIISPESKKSEFKVYEYPGFTVDSEFVEPDPGPIPEGRERCIFCNGGSCKNCGGSGYVNQWIPGEDDQRRVNCTSCMNGRCTVCDDNGWR